MPSKKSTKKEILDKDYCLICKQKVNTYELIKTEEEISELSVENYEILKENLNSFNYPSTDENKAKYTHFSSETGSLIANICNSCFLKYQHKNCSVCSKIIDSKEIDKVDSKIAKLEQKEPERFQLLSQKIEETQYMPKLDVRYYHNQVEKNICESCFKGLLNNVDLEIRTEKEKFKALEKTFEYCLDTYQDDFEGMMEIESDLEEKEEYKQKLQLLKEIDDLRTIGLKSKEVIGQGIAIMEYMIPVIKESLETPDKEEKIRWESELKNAEIIADLLEKKYKLKPVIKVKKELETITEVKKMKVGDTVYIRADKSIERVDENLYTYNDQGLYYYDFDLENLIKFLNGDKYKAIREYDHEEYMKEEDKPVKKKVSQGKKVQLIQIDPSKEYVKINAVAQLDNEFIEDLHMTPQEFRESLEKLTQKEGEEETEEIVSEEKGDFKLEEVKNLYLKSTNTYGLEIPAFLTPYTRDKFPPSDEFIIQANNGNYIRVSMYGKFKGDKFERKHIIKENLKRVCCVHDASHSVALFIQEKDKCDCAIHNRLPLQFPYNDEYILYYTQKYEYPLIMTTLLLPMEYLLKKNGLFTQFRRWCTRIWKIETPRNFYKYFGLNGITQVKGITKHQSTKRSVMNPNPSLDAMSQKTFEVYQELPIFEMKDEEIKSLIKANGIEINPIEKKFDSHGCIACPFRDCEYYQKLKSNYPKMYKQMDEWRITASKDGQEYYWFYNPGSPISNLIKQLIKLQKSEIKDIDKIDKKELELEKIVRKSPNFLPEYSIKKALYDESSKEYKLIRDLAIIDEENRRTNEFMKNKAIKSPCDFTEESGKIRPIMMSNLAIEPKKSKSNKDELNKLLRELYDSRGVLEEEEEAEKKLDKFIRERFNITDDDKQYNTESALYDNKNKYYNLVHENFFIVETYTDSNFVQYQNDSIGFDIDLTEVNDFDNIEDVIKFLNVHKANYPSEKEFKEGICYSTEKKEDMVKYDEEEERERESFAVIETTIENEKEIYERIIIIDNYLVLKEKTSKKSTKKQSGKKKTQIGKKPNLIVKEVLTEKEEKKLELLINSMSKQEMIADIFARKKYLVKSHESKKDVTKTTKYELNKMKREHLAFFLYSHIDSKKSLLKDLEKKIPEKLLNDSMLFIKGEHNTDKIKGIRDDGYSFKITTKSIDDNEYFTEIIILNDDKLSSHCDCEIGYGNMQISAGLCIHQFTGMLILFAKNKIKETGFPVKVQISHEQKKMLIDELKKLQEQFYF